MKTLQATSPRRVLTELTPSRTNVLQLSFLKRRRASSIDNNPGISSQEESISEQYPKRLKECEVDVQYSNIEPILYDNIHKCLPHVKQEKNIIDTESFTLLEGNSANKPENYTLNNGKCYDRSQTSDFQSISVKKTLFEPFFLSKEQIKKYAHILKLRLRLAYYKLQINQPHSAFSTLPFFLMPKHNKKNLSPIKSSKPIISKTTISDMQLPSPNSSQTHEVSSSCPYNNNLILNAFNYSKYNIGLHSPPLSEERYCRDASFPQDFTKDVSK